MKIIFGLGNPDKKYENNLHNLGFMAIDKVADKLSCSFSKKLRLRSLIAETTLNGDKIILVKPITYMNLSGEAVGLVMNYYKADLKDMLVIYDDLDIDVGAIRVKPEGQSGTHNGMRNIVLHLGDTAFARVRIGIKKDNDAFPLIDYVLSDIPADKRDIYDKAVARAADCAADFAAGTPFDRLMNVYNTKA